MSETRQPFVIYQVIKAIEQNVIIPAAMGGDTATEISDTLECSCVARMQTWVDVYGP